MTPEPGNTPADATATTLAAVAMAVLADGESTITGLGESADLFSFCDTLRSLGARLDVDPAGLRVTGCGGHLPEGEATVDLGPNALALEATLAVLAVGFGQYTVTGDKAIDATATVNALRDLGAVIGHDVHAGQPPLYVTAKGLRGGELILPAAIAAPLPVLLAALPLARSDVMIHLPRGMDPAGSLALMRRFSVETLSDADRLIVPAPQRYTAAQVDLRSPLADAPRQS